MSELGLNVSIIILILIFIYFLTKLDLAFSFKICVYQIFTLEVTLKRCVESIHDLLRLFGVDLRVGRSKAGYEGDLVSELLDAVHDEGRGVIGGLDDAPVRSSPAPTVSVTWSLSS